MRQPKCELKLPRKERKSWKVLELTERKKEMLVVVVVFSRRCSFQKTQQGFEAKPNHAPLVSFLRLEPQAAENKKKKGKPMIVDAS